MNPDAHETLDGDGFDTVDCSSSVHVQELSKAKEKANSTCIPAPSTHDMHYQGPCDTTSPALSDAAALFPKQDQFFVRLDGLVHESLEELTNDTNPHCQYTPSHTDLQEARTSGRLGCPYCSMQFQLNENEQGLDDTILLKMFSVFHSKIL